MFMDDFIQNLKEMLAPKIDKRADQVNQTDIYKFLDFDKSKVNRWFKKGDSLTLDDVILISEKLDCSVDDLLGIHRKQQKKDNLTYRDFAQMLLDINNGFGSPNIDFDSKDDIIVRITPFPEKKHTESFNSVKRFIHSIEQLKPMMWDSSFSEEEQFELFKELSEALLLKIPEKHLPYDNKGICGEIDDLIHPAYGEKYELLLEKGLSECECGVLLQSIDDEIYSSFMNSRSDLSNYDQLKKEIESKKDDQEYLNSIYTKIHENYGN